LNAPPVASERALRERRGTASNSGDGEDEALFAAIAADLRVTGYSVNPAALAPALSAALREQVLALPSSQFRRAGVGRQQQHQVNRFVRTDDICWITGESATGAAWLRWAAALQRYLNRHLLLGLFSFESHYAHYAPGDFYRRHYDAFRGEANRMVSLVVYLNPGWGPQDGGELVLFRDEADREGLRVTPLLGTVVAFLSEEFPHEVLPAVRHRYSIAGWYRLNTSTALRVDPPR
jgi:SM-20-related protein